MKTHFSNAISIIKNGIAIKKPFVYYKKKKKVDKLLNILWDEGFISGYKVFNKEFPIIKIFLKYKNETSAINSLKVISKPGLKVNCSLKQLWKLKSIEGVLIISTNKGLKTLEECKKLRLGGELLLIIK